MARTTCEADVSCWLENPVRCISRFSGAAWKLCVDRCRNVTGRNVQVRIVVSRQPTGPWDPKRLSSGSQCADSVAMAAAPL